MKQRPRIYYSDTQKAMMWDRWEKGDSMHAIARLFDRGHGSIQRILAETGGIRPPPRSRSRLSLTLAEREEISRGIVAGQLALISTVYNLSADNCQVNLRLFEFFDRYLKNIPVDDDKVRELACFN